MLAEVSWNLLTLVQLEFSGHDTKPISSVDVGRFWVGVTCLLLWSWLCSLNLLQVLELKRYWFFGSKNWLF